MGDVANRFDNLRVPVTANLRKNGNTPYYGANGIQDFVDGYTHDGEYILVAEDGANNLKNYPINYVSGRIWVNNHAHVLQAIPDLANTRFLGYEIGRSNIVSLLVGGGRAKLNADALMNMSINLPKMQEQELIAEILKTIEHAITLHEEKKRQLKCLKSALLQKMFTDKSGYPVVRFEGFSDEWEQCKLGDVAEITAGGDINKGDLINKGKYPVIANGLNNNGIVGYSNKYKIDAPAVTITGRGRLGVATARFINFTPIVRLISIKSDLDPIYLENVINNTHFVIESTGVPQLTAPQVKRQTVILSNCHIEQTKIGSLLSTLDNAITLHDQKLSLLKRVKQTLLQKMFI